MPRQSTGATAFGWHQQAQAHTPLSTCVCCLATGFSPQEGWGMDIAMPRTLQPYVLDTCGSQLPVDSTCAPQVVYGHVCPSLCLC